MKKYIINPDYRICQNNDVSIVLTSDMTNIYVLGAVEYLIVSCFESAISEESAIDIIKKKFTEESFDENECKDFIGELFDNNILVLVDDTN